MIDLILQGTKANIAALLRDRGLIDADNNPVHGCELAWWAGDGKFMTAKPVYDAQGSVTTPATYLTGFVVLCRLHSAVADNDAISEGSEQWQRSRVAKWIKDNGTLGTFGGLPCSTVNSVRLFRAADVFAWCASHDIPHHEWLGGNSI